MEVPVCDGSVNDQYKAGIERHMIYFKHVCMQMSSNNCERKHLFQYGFYWARLVYNSVLEFAFRVPGTVF